MQRKTNDVPKVQSHPFFGSAADDTLPVHEIIRKIRQPRDFGLQQSKYSNSE